MTEGSGNNAGGERFDTAMSGLVAFVQGMSLDRRDAWAEALSSLAAGLGATSAWVVPPFAGSGTEAWADRLHWSEGVDALEEVDAWTRFANGSLPAAGPWCVVPFGPRPSDGCLAMRRSAGWPAPREVVLKTAAAAVREVYRADEAHRDQGSWCWNAEQDRIWLDSTATRLFAARRSTVAGGVRRLPDHAHAVDADRLETDLRDWLRGERAELEGDYRFGTSEGGWRWLAVTGKVVDRGDDHRPVRARGTVRDIDRHKRELMTAREERETALGASRSKSEFLANVSHEIRTPLNAVIGMARLLEDTRMDATQEEYIRILRGSSETLLLLLDQILDLSRIESGNLSFESEPFQPADVVREVGEQFQDAARARGVTLHVLVAPDDPPPLVSGDSGRLRQVLTHLVSNATRFTQEGSVWLGGRWQRVGDRVRWSFEVVDTGVGIPTERLPHLFSPFAQVEASYTHRFGGTGLGLPISQKICEHFGTRLDVRSAIGVGSTFRFDLDLELAIDPLAAETSQASPTSLASRTLKVLLVEDNPINQVVALRMLERLGHETHVASDGLEAVEACQLGHYDAVLMDLQMPEMDGLEATRQILAATGDAAPSIVAMTAAAFDSDREACVEAGMKGFITKPVRLEELQAALVRAGQP